MLLGQVDLKNAYVASPKPHASQQIALTLVPEDLSTFPPPTLPLCGASTHFWGPCVQMRLPYYVIFSGLPKQKPFPGHCHCCYVPALCPATLSVGSGRFDTCMWLMDVVLVQVT